MSSIERLRGQRLPYAIFFGSFLVWLQERNTSPQTMLQSGNVTQMISKLSRQNKPLFQKVTSWLADTTSNLRSAVDAYRDIAPETPEGKAVAQMTDTVGKLENAYAHALANAGENFQSAEKNTAVEDGVKYSYNQAEGFDEYDVISTVYTIRNELPQRGQDLKKIGTMPSLYRKLFGLSGDVFVSHEHLYQNMVSRDTAETEGRFKIENSADYHELSEETMIDAINQFQNPIAIMESLKDFKEPRLVAILDQKGGDGQNLIAVMELYADRTTSESRNPRNHVLITLYEKSSLPSYIEMTAGKNRVLHIREGVPSETVANLQLAGTESKETLNKNLAQFNKKVKQFKQEHKINYSIRANDTSELSEMQSMTAKQQYTRWTQETESAKRMYGDFDLGTELQDPQFRKLLQSGVSVPDAYLITHQGDIFMNAAQMGVRFTEDKVNRRLAENRARPRENGLGTGAAFVTKPNVSKMTRADRLAISHRVAKGERIVF